MDIWALNGILIDCPPIDQDALACRLRIWPEPIDHDAAMAKSANATTQSIAS